LRWLADTSGDTRDNHVNRDGQQSGQNSGESVLGTAILWHADELLDGPTNKVVPAEGRGKGEAGDNRIE